MNINYRQSAETMATDIEDSKIIPEFVRVVIRNLQGEFLIMKTKYFKQAYENFSGEKVEKNKYPSAAATREIFEETNLLINNLKELEIIQIEIDKELWNGHIYFTRDYAYKFYNKEQDKCLEIKFLSLLEILKLKDLSFVTAKICRDF